MSTTMKTTPASHRCRGLALALCAVTVAASVHAESGFTALFDGPTLNGWKPVAGHGGACGKRGALNPVREWNEEAILADGRHIKVTVNGKVIVDTDLNDVTDPELIQKHPGLFRDRGHLGFLGHNDYVEFRNIRV